MPSTYSQHLVPITCGMIEEWHSQEAHVLYVGFIFTNAMDRCFFFSYNFKEKNYLLHLLLVFDAVVDMPHSAESMLLSEVKNQDSNHSLLAGA